MLDYKLSLTSILIIVTFCIWSSCNGHRLHPNKECKKILASITGIERLKEFLQLLNHSMDTMYFRSKDFIECLEEPFNRSYRDFLTMIYQTEQGNVCQGKHIEMMMELDKKFSLIENKSKPIAIWWDKFFKTVFIICKQHLVDKLNQAEKNVAIDYTLKGIVSLAKNFNWLDESHPILRVEEVEESIDIQDKRLDDIANLVHTSGDIKDLLRWQNILIEDGMRKTKFDILLTKDEIKRIKVLNFGCQLLLHVEDLVMKPIFNLMSLGYDDSSTSLDKHIANYKHIHIWLSSLQLCHLLENIVILELNHKNGLVRFKVAKQGLKASDDKIESRADIINIKYSMDAIMRNKPLISHGDKLIDWRDFYKNPLIVDDVELIGLSSVEDKKGEADLLQESSKFIEKSLEDENLLATIAQSIKSTNYFNEKILNYPRDFSWFK